MKIIENIRIRFLCIFTILLKGGFIMVDLYVTLIIHELRTYKQVPRFLKPKVKETLIALGLEELVKE